MASWTGTDGIGGWQFGEHDGLTGEPELEVFCGPDNEALEGIDRAERAWKELDEAGNDCRDGSEEIAEENVELEVPETVKGRGGRREDERG